MAQRIIVLIHDDWEIRGNGSGNVAHLQYLPALHLLNLADELGLKVTFMAEVMQQLAMSKFAARNRNVRVQARLWEESVQLFADRGHDVQLHIHPHWHDADYEDGAFRLGRNWNLATYEPAKRAEILDAAVDCLTAVMRPVDPHYAVHTFKAGSWGLQPSRGLLEDLERRGFRVIMGAGKAIHLHSPEFHADYTAMEEDVLPYHPDYDDVQRVGPACRLVMLPLPYYSLGLAGTFAKARRILTRGQNFGNAAFPFYERYEITNAGGASPLRAPQRRRVDAFLGRETKTLDVSGALFEELRIAIDQIMARYLAAPVDVVPLVIQSHTKGYMGRWDEVSRFYRYLVGRYGSQLEFMTMTDFLAALPRVHLVARNQA